MKPTVGRIVHYRAHGTPIREDGTQAYPSVCRAALVTEVGAWIAIPGPYEGLDTAANSFVKSFVGGGSEQTRLVVEGWYWDACHLDIRNPEGGFFKVCQHDEETKAGGTWHWPEREPRSQRRGTGSDRTRVGDDLLPGKMLSMNATEERAALVSAGYPDPDTWATAYVPTDEDVERAMRGDAPPPDWKPPTMADEAEALVRAGYPDPREGYRTRYVPTYQDIRRAMRGEGPPDGWTFLPLSSVEAYRMLGGTDPQAIETLRRRDQERASAHRRAGRAAVTTTAPRQRSLPARIMASILGRD